MVITGNGFTVKVAALVAVPTGVVTEIVPVVPVPIVATMTVPEFDIIEETAVPPIFTLATVAPLKLVPFIVIEVPTQPLAEPKLVMVGGRGGVQVYFLPLAGNNVLLLFAVVLAVLAVVFTH